MKILQREQDQIKKDTANEEESFDYNNPESLKSLNKRMRMTQKINTHSQYRNRIFTPESALSALPALQITVMTPTQSVAGNMKSVKKSPQSTYKSKIDKIDISIHSKADELLDDAQK